MEAENIFHKIEKIMREYELIENEERNMNSQTNNPDETQNHFQNSTKKNASSREEYVPSFMSDEFLSFLYKNIHIEQPQEQPTVVEKSTNTTNSTTSEQYSNLEKNSEAEPENKIPDNNKSNYKTNNNEQTVHPEKSIFQQWIDKYYKKIAIKCHPDKVKDKVKQSLFIKTQMYKEQSFLIGILYQCMILKIEIDPLPSILIQRICEEIRVTQEKMIRLKRFRR